ncbi:MAG: hypothetical protein OXC95_11130 [Dehalococcoidia bacterium]|nr:hypothetical protein [Dehalococcoidia bacterium]
MAQSIYRMEIRRPDGGIHAEEQPYTFGAYTGSASALASPSVI